MPIAEETGFIIEIGRWVLKTACQQLKTWLNDEPPIQLISVNISACQFMHDGFLQSVEDVLQQADLEPRCLELEITEPMLISDTKLIELQLYRLKKMGISIALDDFGTGYFSLSYLKNFPIDVLKIDQSFIKDMATQSKGSKIARAIIDMGYSLGQKIVSEGVETEGQLEFIYEYQCDIIQGCFFSPPPPLPVYKMTLLLKDVLIN